MERRCMKKETEQHYKPPLSEHHPHHEKHLCSMVAKRKMKTVARLAKDAKYLCLICGRASRSETNLCWPIEF